MTFLASRSGGKKRGLGQAGARKAAHFVPCLEQLESREVPALIASQVVPLLPPPVDVELNTSEVQSLLSRAAAATSSDNGIVVIVDRGGRILGVRVEGNVDPNITGNTHNLVFAIDGALAEARTAAFFANNQAPLTSRTIGFISQSTVTQREVESDPSITDPNSPIAGPGIVAPIRIGGHFPPGIPFTPQVDLFQIELTNRDTTVVDGQTLPSRFNVPVADIPASIIAAGDTLAPPDSYGFITGVEPGAQPRGIGTLPGGLPIYKDGVLVGGIGIFFPGKTGYADEENSMLNSNFDPHKVDKSLEAEFDALAALGGAPPLGFPVGTLGGIAPLPEISVLPGGSPIPPRIDLVGITLDTIGPGGLQGPTNLVGYANQLLGIGQGNPLSGTNVKVDPGGDTLLAGKGVPTGWLVTPHSGGGISASQVVQMVTNGITQAEETKAAIRLPVGARTEQIFAVSDSSGNILGLYRMPDATVFSLAVAVAKARNVAYYDDPGQLLSVDQVPGIPLGTSFTNRTFRYLAEPYFPEGINGKLPGPFSILNGPGIDPTTGLNTGAPLPASAYFNTILGFEAFHPLANFHAQTSPLNQNGVVFFPGSSGVYLNGYTIVGGFGVSGDGVDQDDVITAAGIAGFEPNPSIRVDQFFFDDVRLPYQKYLRNPEG
jgi:uncharacterized protein GlcG (DUF336 family)